LARLLITRQSGAPDGAAPARVAALI